MSSETLEIPEKHEERRLEDYDTQRTCQSQDAQRETEHKLFFFINSNDNFRMVV